MSDEQASEQAVIDAGKRVEAFLADEAVRAALEAMREQNYALFLGAPDDAGRAQAQAQAVVLKGFEAMLRGTVEHGKRAGIERDQRDRAPATRTF
jgi:hypothetical protein